MKKKILFVDDDPNVVQGLKRMLYKMRGTWDMFFTESGEEALKILSENDLDVIISDMRMPGVDGSQLLDIVSKQYPHTVRIILSGYSDKEMIMKSVKATHQFLLKPCNVETLKSTVERACALKDLLKNEALIKLVTGIKEIPSLPKYYNMVLRELQNKYPSLKKIADIISQDVTMTARVLQFVNSAFFSLPNKISSPQQAVTLLGINTLKALILYVQVFSTISTSLKSSGKSMEALWKHSMMVGNLACEIAGAEAAGKTAEDDAFAAGMLHDIGKILLMEKPCHISNLKEYTAKKKCSDLEAEYSLLETSHAEVGAYLLGLWGIGDHITEAVAFHHHPSRLNDDRFTPLTAVHVANALMKGDNYIQHIDLGYLEKINLAGRMETWLECYNRFKLKGACNE